MERANLPGWCWAEIQQFALARSSSSLHSEACEAFGASDGVIHSRISLGFGSEHLPITRISKAITYAHLRTIFGEMRMWGVRVGRWSNGADSCTVGGQDNATMGRLGDSQWGSMTMRQWHNGVMARWDNETTGPWIMGQWDNGPWNKRAIQQVSTCCRCAWQGVQCQNFWMLSCLTLRGRPRAVSRHVHGRNVGHDCSSGN